MPIVSSMGPRVPLLAGVRALLAGAVVLALALGPGEVAPRAAAADLEPPALPEFSSTFGGLTSDVALRSGQTGYGALAELGARWLGTESFRERAWLIRWDLGAAARGGVPGSVLPVTASLGGRAHVDAEAGRRLEPARPWSALVIAGAASDAEWLAPTSSRSATLSDLNGTERVSVTGRVRAGLGASWLGPGKALTAIAFLQEARRPTGLSPAGLMFTEGGVGLRLELARAFSLRTDATWGTALSRQAGLGLSDRTTHVEVHGGASVWLGRRFWIGLDGSAARDTDRVSYPVSHTFYSTTSTPELAVTFSAGYSLDRR